METITSFPGRDGHVGDPVRLGIVTVSDRASRGEYMDEGGPAILAFFQDAIQSPWTAIYRCVPDERDAVEAALIDLTDMEQCSVVVTTGGTGPASRDITPEATEAVCDRMMPGFGEQMRAISLKYVPTAILSRQVGGLRGRSLIFNLPGRPKSIRETIDEIWKAVPYCIDLMGGPYMDMDADVCDAFRPPAARR
ncbi:MAG: molybdopterin adenylyltransferase [Candidatus Poseidoniales archaeon]